MAIEIERKFLVSNEDWTTQVLDQFILKQGYLSTTPERTVRVRLTGDKGVLTIKGKTEGIQRLEFEYDIPGDEAKSLMSLALDPPIEKTRYLVPHQGYTWEVDVFEGANKGLVLAEIELDHEYEHFSLPSWVGSEVSHDPRYYNSHLSKVPFTTWRTLK
ncbi:MAG: CYTH domain-containing protein [Flavobacteriales bacterium]|jgi:adenylate cyclase|tara:strand:- start:1898 stop:2374 length:477 start_codon:yes stop_codon:yes gene_type:complete